MYKYYKALFYLGSIIICISIISCEKDIDTPPPLPNDTIPIPGSTKPDPSDTVPLIRKLEEVYSERSFLHKIKTISFYYDNQKRVSSIGLKNYASSFDSGTIKLFYTGNQTKPFKIISPNTQFSKWGIDNVFYDTTYFFYNTQGLLIKDSGYVMSFNRDNSWKQLLTRHYNYISSSQFSVQMAKKQYDDNTMLAFRIDTVQFNPNITFDKIKILFKNIQMSGSNLAVIENVRHSGFLNPLAKLNISGLHYFWITTPNDFEILGNTNYKSIDRGNIIPTYIDFASAYLPSTFFNSAYDVPGVFFYGDEFTIQVIPWAERADYPKTLKVKGSSSLPETEVIYNYYY